MARNNLDLGWLQKLRRHGNIFCVCMAKKYFAFPSPIISKKMQLKIGQLTSHESKKVSAIHE